METDGSRSSSSGIKTLSQTLLVVDLCLIIPITGVSALVGTFLWPKFFKVSGEVGCVFGDKLHQLCCMDTWIWFTVVAAVLAIALAVKEMRMKSRAATLVVNLFTAGVCLVYTTCYTVLNVVMVYDFLFRLPRVAA